DGRRRASSRRRDRRHPRVRPARASGRGLLDLDALPIAAAPFSVAASVGTTSYFGFWHRDATALGFAFTRPCSVLWQ
ncbi:MAG: hypothetical protein AAFR54_22155, partial [Planctomycetota bacterium]